MTAARFLREHWQKKPLLVRGAFPDMAARAPAVVAPDALFTLAKRDDVVARTVVDRGPSSTSPRFALSEGAPRARDVRALAPRTTFLVQGTEMHVPDAWELLRQFAFIPRARIDDLMVSYATEGGGVGPHFDLYDVFLVQSMGRRRWRVSQQRDLSCDPREELRILKDLTPTLDEELAPGDLLYVPPRAAHEGTAVDACMTCSVGFLAPTHEQIVGNYLAFAGVAARRARGSRDALYADPDLTEAARPALVDDAMLARYAEILRAALGDRAPDDDTLAVFVGRYLTGPKPFARFVPPREKPSARAFATRLSQSGALALTGATRMLVRAPRVFVNGEAHVVDERAFAILARLADDRALTLPLTVDGPLLELLHAWVRAGFVAVR